MGKQWTTFLHGFKPENLPLLTSPSGGFSFMANEHQIRLSTVIRDMGLKLVSADQKVIGFEVSKTYNSIFGELPPKREVKYKNGFSMMLNHYPADFRPIIVNCINDFLKKRK